MAKSVMLAAFFVAVMVHQASSYVIDINGDQLDDNKIVKQRDKYYEEQNDPRFIGSLLDSYMKFAQRFDASNAFKKLQKFGINRFLSTNVATVNRAFSSAWYRAKNYYYSAYSGVSSLMAALPENTRERLLENLVHNGVPYVMNATGWFDTSAVDWAVDTGSKVLDAYKKERQGQRRHASGVTSTTDAAGLAAVGGGDLPRRFNYRQVSNFP
jgi:hypothetical protein